MSECARTLTTGCIGFTRLCVLNESNSSWAWRYKSGVTRLRRRRRPDPVDAAGKSRAWRSDLDGFDLVWASGVGIGS